MRTLKDYASRVEAELERLLPQTRGEISGEIPPLLCRAMRYSLLSGGKRLRPAMLLAAVDMLHGDARQALTMAACVEMIHTYSLIHDDLPGMDGDVLRRGRPTNHVVFGVGQAILAGDALLNYAFEAMLQNALNYPDNALAHLRAIAEIARGAGVRGMIAGQCLDLELEKSGGGEAELENIQLGKTCAMFIYPLRAAGRLCGADQAALDALGRFGRAFGRLFQTVDDLLDVEGDEAQLGKSVGKDSQSGKLTAVSVYSLEGARLKARTFYEEAAAALSEFGERAVFFRELLKTQLDRQA